MNGRTSIDHWCRLMLKGRVPFPSVLSTKSFISTKCSYRGKSSEELNSFSMLVSTINCNRKLTMSKYRKNLDCTKIA